MRKAADQKEDGFTLVEMLVVLAIIVGVASIATLRLNVSQTARTAQRTTTQVLNTLKLARLDAIQNGAIRTVILDTTKRQLVTSGHPPVELDPGVSVSFSNLRQQRNAASGPPSITFLPDGRSSGGKVEIASGDLHRIIVVNWLTGFANEADHAAAG
jgi:general secretion pathway protein H